MKLAGNTVGLCLVLVPDTSSRCGASSLFFFSLLFTFSTAAWAFGSCFLGWGVWLSHHKEQSPSLVFSSLG